VSSSITAVARGVATVCSPPALAVATAAVAALDCRAATRRASWRYAGSRSFMSATSGVAMKMDE